MATRGPLLRALDAVPAVFLKNNIPDQVRAFPWYLRRKTGTIHLVVSPRIKSLSVL
jgi:hypothetical protein